MTEQATEQVFSSEEADKFIAAIQKMDAVRRKVIDEASIAQIKVNEIEVTMRTQMTNGDARPELLVYFRINENQRAGYSAKQWHLFRTDIDTRALVGDAGACLRTIRDQLGQAIASELFDDIADTLLKHVRESNGR